MNEKVQAYLVYVKNNSQKHLLDIVKKIYTQKGLIIEEYKLGDRKYVVCYTDPYKVLPFDLLKRIYTEKIRTEELSKLSRKDFESKVDRKFKKGTKIEVISGPYKGMKGVVEKILPDSKIKVYLSVFGYPVPVELKSEDVIPLE